MGNWSELPTELLCLVSDRLRLDDYVRFGAVCVPWRKAVSGGRRHPPLRPQPPWLVSVDCSGRAEATSADFFCLADKRSYRMDLPEPPFRHRDREVIGSSGGWLVTADQVSEMHMLNPLTGVQIPLPSILTLPPVKAFRDANGCLDGDYMGYSSPPKVVVSHSSSSDWIAVLIFFPGRRLAFARAGDTAWTLLSLREDYFGMVDVTFHKGQVYAVRYQPGATTAWDLAGPLPRARCIGPPLERRGYTPDRRYLVDSGGDLLQILRKDPPLRIFINEVEDENEDYSWRMVGFEVFRLHKEQEWVRVKNLGERALFLGLNNSMSLSTMEHPELKRNCIYFTLDRDSWDKIFFYKNRNWWGESGLGVFNLEDGSINSYNDHRCRPPLVWIMPRLF